MKHYIILRNGAAEHYFLGTGGGIHSHSQKNGIWSSPQIIDARCTSDFGLFLDENSFVNIIGSDRSNNIVYTIIRGDLISHHTILSGKPSVRLSDFQIRYVNGFLNMFYTATVGSDTMLIHCVLGNNSQPSVLARTMYSDFFIRGCRIYYTNEKNVLGYSDFSDGKPSAFIPMYSDSSSMYIDESGGIAHMTWKCGKYIMLDDKKLISAPDSEHPLLVKGSRLMLMWRTGGIVNYVPADVTDKETGSPMRFISTGSMPEIFCIQNENEFDLIYGIYSGNDISLFGRPDLFSTVPGVPARSFVSHDDEIQNLKITLSMIQREISDIKLRINTLSKYIE